ncbi:exonuclease V [Centroberyx affinis]|uniref:exonuclease V n=1 Tax=Centroberyx affinis TaxID=166261 RepID=UPI003A5C3976
MRLVCNPVFPSELEDVGFVGRAAMAIADLTRRKGADTAGQTLPLPCVVWPNMQRRQIVYIPKPTPMERFSQKHLCIGQLCEQRSCELKMINRLKEQQKSLKHRRHGGKDLKDMDHAGFFGVQMSREDKETLKLLDMMQKMSALEAGNTVKDFPVFGVLEDVFLTGIIDTLHYDKQRKVVLSDVETLNKDNELFVAEMGEHEFQELCTDPCNMGPCFIMLQHEVMVVDEWNDNGPQGLVTTISQVKKPDVEVLGWRGYTWSAVVRPVGMHKLLFDSMVNGHVKREQYIEHLQLQPRQTLGAKIQGLTQSLGCPSNTFGELLDHVLTTLASSKIKRIAKLKIIYLVEGKDTKTSSGTMWVQFKEGQLRSELKGYLAYWKGQREPKGVDIEDAWKCETCSFKENCEWKNHDLVETRMDCRLQNGSIETGSGTGYKINNCHNSGEVRVQYLHKVSILPTPGT